VRQSILESEGRSKPRRFSTAFIAEEREKAKQFREIFRDIIKSMQNKSYIQDQNGDIQILHSE
jgi:hypothetical protein